MDYPPPYLAGIELFNQGRYWHAHEEWEAVWRTEQQPDRQLFYKGIIQAAAALVHWQRGNLRGLHLNWHKARPKLAAQPTVVLGINIPALIDAMDRFEAAEGIGISPPHLDLDPT